MEKKRKGYLFFTILGIILVVLIALLCVFTVIKEKTTWFAFEIPFGLTIERLYAICAVSGFVMFIYTLLSFITIGTNRRKSVISSKWPEIVLGILMLISVGIGVVSVLPLF